MVTRRLTMECLLQGPSMMLYLAAMAREPAFHLGGVGRVPNSSENQVLLLPTPILEACAEGYGFARSQKSCQNYQGLAWNSARLFR